MPMLNEKIRAKTTQHLRLIGCIFDEKNHFEIYNTSYSDVYLPRSHRFPITKQVLAHDFMLKWATVSGGHWIHGVFVVSIVHWLNSNNLGAVLTTNDLVASIVTTAVQCSIRIFTPVCDTVAYTSISYKVPAYIPGLIKILFVCYTYHCNVPCHIMAINNHRPNIVQTTCLYSRHWSLTTALHIYTFCRGYE